MFSTPGYSVPSNTPPLTLVATSAPPISRRPASAEQAPARPRPGRRPHGADHVHGARRAVLRVPDDLAAALANADDTVFFDAASTQLRPKLPEAKKGFVLLPRRWVVERSFGWMARFRRLARDYDACPKPWQHFITWLLLS